MSYILAKGPWASTAKTKTLGFDYMTGCVEGFGSLVRARGVPVGSPSKHKTNQRLALAIAIDRSSTVVDAG
jgi:hypothetical protein